MDGTLLNTLHSIAWIGNTTLHKFGLPPIETDAYKLLVGNGADTLMRRMLRTVGAKFSDAQLTEFRAEYDRLYESDPLRLVTPYPGIPELLRELKGRGFRLGVLSNKPDNMTRILAESFYAGLFDAIRGQVPGIPKKPDPTAALGIAKGFSIPPREIHYIGDSGVDMLTGKNAGMDSCGVLWGFRDRKELEENGAVFTVGSASELLETVMSR